MRLWRAKERRIRRIDEEEVVRIPALMEGIHAQIACDVVMQRCMAGFGPRPHEGQRFEVLLALRAVSRDPCVAFVEIRADLLAEALGNLHAGLVDLRAHATRPEMADHPGVAGGLGNT